MINIILIDVEDENVRELSLNSILDLEFYLKSKLIDYTLFDNNHYLFFSDDKNFKKYFQVNELSFCGNGLLIGYDIINNQLCDCLIDIDDLKIVFSTKKSFLTKIFNYHAFKINTHEQ